jgi:hypothetical protein
MYRFLLAAVSIFIAASGYTEELPVQMTPQVDSTKAEQLSDEKKLSTAEKNIKEMQQDLAAVLRLRKAASDQKDVIRVNCLDKKLTNIKTYLGISLKAFSALQEAVTNGNKENSVQEFNKISLSQQWVKTYKTEAEQCIGEMAFAGGKSTREIEEDKNIVWQYDPTLEELFKTVVVRPAAASQY